MNLFSIATMTFALFLIAPCASAQLSCEPKFVQSSQTINVADVEVRAGASTSETFQIRVRNEGTSAANCSATLRIAKLSSSPSTDTIPYTLQSRGRVLEILPNESVPATAGSDLSIANLPRRTSDLNLPFRLNVPSDWGLKSGMFTEDLIVTLLDASDNISDTMHLSISLFVAPAVEIRVVGVTGKNVIANINLGALDPEITSTSDPFGVRVWSTSPYTISFQSQNAGKLVHNSVSASIGYELFMNRQSVGLLGTIAGYFPTGTDSLGDFHSMSVRVQPFRAHAGDYSDRVEVTVTAN